MAVTLSHTALWATLVVTGVGTYLTRLSFLAVAGRFRDLSPRTERALSLIPPAVLASLVAPAVLVVDGSFDVFNARVVAAAAAAVAGYRSRNVVVTLVVGIATLMILDATV
jgi:branched-subunit amino acid transport protein